MKSGENFKLLYDLADKLGAAGVVHASVLNSDCIKPLVVT